MSRREIHFIIPALPTYFGLGGGGVGLVGVVVGRLFLFLSILISMISVKNECAEDILTASSLTIVSDNIPRIIEHLYFRVSVAGAPPCIALG